MLWTLMPKIRHRRGRATLTLMSIVIGVAAVVAVKLTTSTTHESYDEMYQMFAGQRRPRSGRTRAGKTLRLPRPRSCRNCRGSSWLFPASKTAPVLADQGKK